MMEIRAEHLTKSYEGRPVLQDVTFTAGAGITRIAGRSGAGKTTLLRILLGLETAESGRVLVPDGCRWAAVFQEDRLLMAKSAGGNLRFALGGTYDAARAAALRCILRAAEEKPVLLSAHETLDIPCRAVVEL